MGEGSKKGRRKEIRGLLQIYSRFRKLSVARCAETPFLLSLSGVLSWLRLPATHTRSLAVESCDFRDGDGGKTAQSR